MGVDNLGGFSKLFGSMWQGSLYGRFEASAVFMVFLSLCDRDGHVDMTPEAIAGTCGWPLDFIRSGIAELEKPDPRSRTPDEDGRRIIRLDDHRDWGWMITNYAKYRDEMRSMDRREYLRLKKREQRSRQQMSTCQPSSTSDNRRQPIAEAEAEADSRKEKKGEREARAPRSAPARRLPEDFTLTPERRAMADAENADPDREFAAFTDYWRAASGAKARKHDWDGTWRNWCRRAGDFKPRQKVSDEPQFTWRPGPEDC